MDTVKQRKPQPNPKAPRRTAILAWRHWESQSREAQAGGRSFVLVETRYSSSRWEVYLLDGTWIGTVGRYHGSLDRKIRGTRLRHPGKRRVLWSEQGTPETDRMMYEYVSRADAIRALMSDHERRSQ